MDGATEQDVVRLLSDLVSIDSVNPSLVPGAAGEGAIADYVQSWLRDAGLEVEVVEVRPGRPNIVARLPGTGRGRSLMLNAHMDTVGTAGVDAGLVPRIEGDRLYGRGAYDMKGGLAAVLLAARAVARTGGTGGDLVVTPVMDEEYASLGTQKVVESIVTDAAIVTEPTGLRLCTAHKGFAWIRVVTEGRAAHGSKPELGVDAVAHMGRVLRRLEIFGAELHRRPGHALLGTGSVHASLIQGGQELSSYPEQCSLDLERRTIPGETELSVMEEVNTWLRAEQAADSEFRARAQLLLWRNPFEVRRDEAIVQTTEHAACELLGTGPELYGDSPWMDAALLSAAGIPTVVFGPGGQGAHAAVEWASISQVRLCADILARTILQFCEPVPREE